MGMASSFGTIPKLGRMPDCPSPERATGGRLQ